MGESKPRPAGAGRRHEREVARTDRRWFVFTLVGATALLGFFFGARAIYHLTGPHPQVILFLRRARGLARWVIPRWRRGKKW